VGVGVEDVEDVGAEKSKKLTFLTIANSESLFNPKGSALMIREVNSINNSLDFALSEMLFECSDVAGGRRREGGGVFCDPADGADGADVETGLFSFGGSSAW